MGTGYFYSESNVSTLPPREQRRWWFWKATTPNIVVGPIQRKTHYEARERAAVLLKCCPLQLASRPVGDLRTIPCAKVLPD